MRKQKAQKQLLSGLLALMLCLFLLPATVFAAGGVTLKVSPANAADDTAPRAEGATYQTLAGAIAAAESGDIIEITENISVDATIQIATDLTICGSDATITVTRDAGHTAGPVLEIEDGASVTITNLILDGGAQWDDAENHYERTNSGVTAGHGARNTASTGTGYDDPGSYLLVHGSLTLTTGAQVQNCHYRITRTANANDTAAYAGGAAVYVTGTGVLTMEQDARVHDNMLSVDSAASEVWYASGAGGAAIRVNGGTLNLRDSASIDCNSALDTKANGWGGGVCLGGAGTLNLESGSISGNYARNGGGGIAAMQGGGEINLSGVSISNNVCAGPQGGGGIGTMTVSLAGPLTITMSGGEISGNASASNTQGPGGGIYLMNSSSAISTFVMTGGTITGNKLGTASSSKGGGVCLGQNATAVLLDGEISGNIVSDNLRYGQAPGTAVAIGHAKAKCYLKADTMTIGGDIHVGSAQYIELIGASETMGNYVASTDRSASYMAEGRVVVRPGSYEYNGTAYEVTDAEQYVNHFSSTYKGVTTNTEFTGNPDSENALVLRGWTLSFDLNVPAGAAAKPNPESIAPISELYMYQNIMGLAGFPNPDPTLDGYTFAGWYTNKAGTGTAITNAHVMGNFSTTLYAKWTEVTYALTMNLDGGDGTDVSGSYAKDAEIAIDAGTKAGGNDFAYVFDGWLTSGGGTFANDKDAKTTFTMPGNDTTITATWRQVPTYALTMNLDGGDGTDVSGNYPEGTEIAIDAGMREHYAFAGWTTSDGGTFANDKDAETTFTMPAHDTTITAAWTPLVYVARVTTADGYLKDHTTIESAFDDANEKGTATVTLLTDCTVASYIPGIGTPMLLVKSGNDITVELAGYTLTGNGRVPVIKVGTSTRNPFATLTLNDSSAEKTGKLTGGRGTNPGGGIYVTGGNFIMNGGTITGNHAPEGCAGGVAIETGTFEMNGGEISGNTASSLGGGVYITDYLHRDGSTTFTMNGGKITGNSGTQGGGVFLATGNTVFTMNGGEISGNTATGSVDAQGKPKDSGIAGGVAVSSGQFNMNGGTITGNNAADLAGGVFFAAPNASMNVSGNPVITGNTSDQHEYEENVFLRDGVYITFADALTDGAQIGVTTQTAPTIDAPVEVTTAETDTDYYVNGAQYFTSDRGYNVRANNDGHYVELYLAYHVTYDANRGSGDMTDPSSPYDPGDEVTVLTNRFTAPDGYAFKNWNTEADGNGISYDPGDTFIIDENTTLYAQWKAVYTLTLDPQGGKWKDDGSTGNRTQTVYFGDLYGELPTPERDGYHFSGWGLKQQADCSQDGHYHVDEDTMVATEGDHTLFAHWQQKKLIQINYDPSQFHTYDGQEHSFVFTVTDGPELDDEGWTIYYLEHTGDGHERPDDLNSPLFSTTPPINADNYCIVITHPGTEGEDGYAPFESAFIHNGVIIRPISVNVSSHVTKVYDGGTHIPVTAADVTVEESKFIAGDDVTVIVASDAQLLLPSAGVTDRSDGMLLGVSLAGADAVNYDLTYTTYGTITPRPVTIKGDVSKVYDGTADIPVTAGNLTLEGCLEGDDVKIEVASGAKLTLSSAAAGSTNKGGGNVTAVLTGVSLVGADAGNYGLEYEVYGTITARSGGGGGTTSYTITSSAGSGGSISPSGRVSVTRGGSRTFTITADSGYSIADVLVDGTSVGAVSSYTFSNVRSNHTITVSFKKTTSIADPDDTGVSDWLNTSDHIRYLNGYPGGSFRSENKMTRAEAAQMFYNLLLDQNVNITVSFPDVVSNAWYAQAVNTLASLGIIKGYDDGTYGPENPITRAEFTTIAMRFATLDTSGGNIFSDVQEGAWYYDYVVGSIKYGWINGYPDGTFKPNSSITRAEVATITNRMLGRAADKAFIDRGEGIMVYNDLATDHWAYYDIMEASNAHDYTQSGGAETWTGLR